MCENAFITLYSLYLLKPKLIFFTRVNKLTFWWVIKLCIIFENSGFVELVQNVSCKAPYLHLKKVFEKDDEW